MGISQMDFCRIKSNQIKVSVYRKLQLSIESSHCVLLTAPDIDRIKPNPTVCLPSNQFKLSTIKPNQNVNLPSTQSKCVFTIKPNQTVCLPSNPIKLCVYHQTVCLLKPPDVYRIKPNQIVCLPLNTIKLCVYQVSIESNHIKLCVYHQTQSKCVY